MLFGNIYNNRSVLITGHTGFKGSWLSIWLQSMNAKNIGYSLEPPTQPSLFEAARAADKMIHLTGDVRDLKNLTSVLNEYQPEIIFHLAAQALVIHSYSNPVETYTTNVIGTMNILEAARHIESIKAVVIVTSDKCYENKEWIWGYRENDPMGGFDPYSSSKGCAELVTSAYRNSFFNPEQYQKTHNTLIASARAGNVIAGGDWGKDRLVPNIIRAAIKNGIVTISSPYSIRPWQHVLEPLSGYLLLGQKLFEGKKEFAEGWNFGPNTNDHLTVLKVAQEFQTYWDKINFQISSDDKNFHEAETLKLDCSKSYDKLEWQPIWNSSIAIQKTIQWYRNFYESSQLITENQISEYIRDAKQKKIVWSEN